MRRLKLAALTAGCLLVSAACGSNAKSVSGPMTTRLPATTVAVGPTAPLTGLPQPDEALRTRPVLVVKIDNHPDARPQFGIEKADDIVEEKVEGGVSRFMAVFQSEDSDKVGPVRSLRTTDASWLKPEGGMIAYSGGIDPVKALLGPAGVVDLGGDNHGATYYKRRSDRPYEHSMYTMTPVLRTLTPKGLPAPKPLYQYLAPGQSFGGAGAAPAVNLQGRMADGPTATSFDWNYDAATHKYIRGTDGKAHLIENVGQISMDNVILQFTDYRATPWRDRANSAVDEAIVVGSGDAWILSGGQVVKGRWTRTNPGDITSFTDANGATVKIAPGHTWLSLVPTGEAAATQ